MITIERVSYDINKEIYCLPIFLVTSEDIRYDFIDDINYQCIASNDVYHERIIVERNVNFHAIKSLSYFCSYHKQHNLVVSDTTY